MSEKQGMKHYPIGIREKIVSEYKSGVSQLELSRRYGITSSMSRRGNPYDKGAFLCCPHKLGQFNFPCFSNVV